MSGRNLAVCLVAAAIAVVVIAAAVGQEAKPTAPLSTVAGAPRYQIVEAQEGLSVGETRARSVVFLLDTETGLVWRCLIGDTKETVAGIWVLMRYWTPDSRPTAGPRAPAAGE